MSAAGTQPAKARPAYEAPPLDLLSALDAAPESVLPVHVVGIQLAAGNSAISRLLGGRPAGIQRAPLATAPGLDTKARVDRLRLAVKQAPMPKQFFLVDIEAVASALTEMTKEEGRAVKREFERQTGWNLAWLISGELEIDGKKVITEIGPHNRRRLLTLLSGTVAAPEADPVAALESGQAVGSFAAGVIGTVAKTFGQDVDEAAIASATGAAAAANARDANLTARRKAEASRTRAQAIELKVWLDKGQKDKVFALFGRLAKPADDEQKKEFEEQKKALSDAYAAQFGEQLYSVLTKRLKGRDQERIIALWMGDTVAAERLALQADLEKLKKAESTAQEFGGVPAVGLLAKPMKEVRERREQARAAVEGRLESLEPEERQAVLGQGDEGSALAAQLGVGKNAVVTALVKGDRPEMLAARLARADAEGTLKAGQIEDALRELRQAAERDARRQREAAAKEADAPELSTEQVVGDYFTRLHAHFASLRSGKLLMPLIVSSVGNKTERQRNTALLLRQGQLPEWQELYFAATASPKDMERIRAILGDRTQSQVRELADEYAKETKRDLTEDVLGNLGQRRAIEKPTFDDLRAGRLPKDLAAAREEYEEKKRLLGGGQFEESQPAGSEAAQADLVAELAASRETAAAPVGPAQRPLTGPPVPSGVVESMGSRAAAEGDKRRLREEAVWVFRRISSIYSAVIENRGPFARVRDKLGNLEHSLVRAAQRDADESHRAVDQALSQEPPEMVAARGAVSELYLIEARMTHNVGVYKQATEEAFSAFVDVAVLVVSTLASGGAAGAIMGAIRATAATIATKATLKGSKYSADEFFADIRGGVFSAGAGKLAEKLVPRLAAAYAKTAKTRGWDKGWAGAVSAKIEPAVMWEVENLISGGGAGLLEAAYQGDIDPLTESVGLQSHGMALGQHVASAPIRRRSERKRAARERARAERQSPGRQPGEQSAQPGEPAHPTEAKAEVAVEPGGDLAAPETAPSSAARRPAPLEIGALPVTGAGGSPPAPPSRPPTGPIDPVAQRLLPEDGARSLQQVADSLDVIVRVRPMNAEAIVRLQPRLDAAGNVLERAAVAKPSIVKAKTINAIDEHIGAPRDSRGLVGLFEPQPPSVDLPADVLARAEERYVERLKEWQNREADYGQYIKDGTLRIDGGLVEVVDPRLATSPYGEESVYRRIAGDIDLFDITHADGSPLSPKERTELTALLRSMGINVEHGAHEWWKQQDPGSFSEPGYEAIRQKHQSDEPLIAFLPQESPQSAWADTRLSRPPRADKPGQRITPLREGEPIAAVSLGVGQEQPPGQLGPARTAAEGAVTAAEPARTAAEPARTAAEAGTGGAAIAPPAAAEARWAGRLVGSDVPAEAVGASVGRGVSFTEKPRGQFRVLGKPSGGTSESVIVLDRQTNKKYLFKPLGGERAVSYAEARGVVAGHYAERAKAAEIAAGELNLDTPGVELVEINGRKGSLTAWIEPSGPEGSRLSSLADYLRPTADTSDIEATQRLRDLQQDPDFQRAWNDVQALDYLINNVDRVQNFGNYMIEIGPDGGFRRLIPIDSELSFTSTAGRAVIERKTSFLEGIALSDEMIAQLLRLGANRQAFIERIRPLVGEKAVAGVLQRLDELVAHAAAQRARRAGASGSAS